MMRPPRPVAEATVGWMISIAHNVMQKDRLIRTGQWDERSKYMGSELRDRTPAKRLVAGQVGEIGCRGSVTLAGQPGNELVEPGLVEVDR